MAAIQVETIKDNIIPQDNVIELLINLKFDTLNTLIDLKLIDLAKIQICDFLTLIYVRSPSNFADIFNFIMENGYVLTRANLSMINSALTKIILDYLEKNPHKYDVNSVNIRNQTVLYCWTQIDCIKRLLQIYPNYNHYNIDIYNDPWWCHIRLSQEFFDYLCEIIDINKKFLPVSGVLLSYAAYVKYYNYRVIIPNLIDTTNKLVANNEKTEEVYINQLKYQSAQLEKKDAAYNQLKAKYDEQSAQLEKKEAAYDQLKAKYDELLDQHKKKDVRVKIDLPLESLIKLIT